jgi:hypothetical protein
MEIHGPEGPTNSFKDFAIHIIIVTIGILIALGLEGIRETIHEHRVVRDARENFQAEFQANRNHLDKELKNDQTTLDQIGRIVTDLPTLRSNPSQFALRVAELKPSGYFFSNSRWESALSTGALGQMSVDEVNQYAEINFLVRTYTSLESQSSTDWGNLEAFFSAHQNPTPAEINNGVEKLFLFRHDVKGLNQVGEEFSGALNSALARK